MDPIHHVLESIGIHAAFQCAFRVPSERGSLLPLLVSVINRGSSPIPYDIVKKV
jgi:hypothetical protein